MRDAGVSNGAGYPAVTLLQEQLKGAHAATVRAMRARYPRWTDELMQRNRLKYAKLMAEGTRTHGESRTRDMRTRNLRSRLTLC